MSRRWTFKSGTRALLPAVLLLPAFLSVSCDDEKAPATPSNVAQPSASAPTSAISLTQNSLPFATHKSLDEALAEASKLAGFTVLAPTGLPAGFAVTGVDVISTPGTLSPGAPRSVQLLVRSDNGGVIINQLNVRTEPDAAMEKLPAPSGEYYASRPADSRTYIRLTSNRTYAILTRGNITPEQAREILSGFPE